mgnify:CR=1 FL=1
MLIYFIRHGRTTHLEEHRYQTPESSLSANGEVQASKVAERLKDLAIQEIWTSPMARAKETTTFINQSHHVPVVEYPQLSEIRRASIITGKIHTDPEIQAALKVIHDERDKRNPYFRYEDGESLADVIERAKEFLQILEDHSQGKDNSYLLCVTSHGISLSIILLCVLLGREATPELIMSTLYQTGIENTGISVVSVNDKKWKLITLNDFAHL